MLNPVTIELKDANDDGELAALSHLVSILDRFEDDRRQRMINYVCQRYPKPELMLAPVARISGHG